MKDWIALAMVVIAYILGHFGGYRLCKLRVKNMVRKRINYAKILPIELSAYEMVMHDITRL